MKHITDDFERSELKSELFNLALVESGSEIALIIHAQLQSSINGGQIIAVQMEHTRALFEPRASSVDSFKNITTKYVSKKVDPEHKNSFDYFVNIEYHVPWNSDQVISMRIYHCDIVDPELLRKIIWKKYPIMSCILLKVFGIIDLNTLVKWLRLFECLTHAQFVIMHHVVCSPRHSLANTAKRLKLSPRSVQNHVYNIMNAVEIHLPCSESDDGHRSQMVDLFNAFYFLKFVELPD